MIRPIKRPGNSVDSAHTTLPTKKTANPITTGTLRPKRSDKGPTINCPIAKIAKKTVTSWVVAAVETWSESPMLGRDGSKIFVANVPSAESAASTATTELRWVSIERSVIIWFPARWVPSRTTAFRPRRSRSRSLLFKPAPALPRVHKGLGVLETESADKLASEHLDLHFAHYR